MKKLFFLIILPAVLFSCTANQNSKIYNDGINIIPKPVELSVTDSSFYTLTASTAIVTKDDCLLGTANYLSDKFRSSTGYALATLNECPSSNYIRLSINPSLETGDEGYTLNSSPKCIEIAAKTETGVFYGIQTLLQLFPAEIESSSVINGLDWTIPSVEILDYPRFPYRGHLMDVCRHFRSTEMIKKQIDVLCMYKINRIHIHLTDDQAWRIEIKKYPRLTEIGSIRTEGDGQKYGPFFYTQEEIRDIVSYAASRHIEVIPEIEMPGHGMAALTAYPELSCTGGPFAQPRIIWGVEEDVYCVGNEATFEFLENVLKEVAELFPAKYIHIGGDECPKVRWKKCPKCQKRADELGLRATEKHTVEEQLQSYFVTRMEKYIESLGKRLIGWDEILEGGLAPSATVMSWRGIEGGLAAASMDHDVIMTPESGGMYIDYLQGASEVEPTAIGGNATLRKTYSYEPVPAELAEDMRHHILGAQCNLWTEYVIEDNHWEYMMYPRLLALSEVTWSEAAGRDFDSFCKRLNNSMVRLDMHGITYHIPMPEGTLTRNVAFLEDSTEILFKNSRDLPMVYTLDGKNPTPNSALYEKPIKVGGTGSIKIATLLQSGKLSNIREVTYSQVIPLKPVTEPAFDSSSAKCSKDLKEEAKIARLRIAPGLYTREEDWGKARFEKDTIVSKLFDAKLWDMNSPSLAVFEGYFNADTTGVYGFTTDVEELWIDGQRLIVNEKLSRHSQNKVQLALEKGPHYYKVVFSNMIKDGWPNCWNRIGFRFLRPGTENRRWIEADMSGELSYKLDKDSDKKSKYQDNCRSESERVYLR